MRPPKLLMSAYRLIKINFANFPKKGALFELRQDCRQSSSVRTKNKKLNVNILTYKLYIFLLFFTSSYLKKVFIETLPTV